MKYRDRAFNAIHGSALTNSKRPESFVKGVYPQHLSRAYGCYAWDSFNNKYIDYICALGTNLVGYANPKINEAIKEQLCNGIVYSLGSSVEVEAAELLKEIFFSLGKVRFLKTGTEAALASLKIARSHTGRARVLTDHYHGWNAEFTSVTPPAIGCAKHDFIKPFSTLDQIDESIAAVIIEPVVTDHSPARIQFLKDLREKCTKTGTLLIFDEIITGFRWKNWSVSRDTGIIPDILLLGKCMAGGMPLSAIITAHGVGEGQDWFVSSTFAGETLSLAAFKEFVKLLRGPMSIDKLWIEGQRFKDEFNALSDIVKIEGYPTRGTFVGTDLNKALFFQEACKAGILLGPSFFYCFDHIPHRELVLNSFRDILQNIKHGQVKLEGEMPQKPFAQKVRETK